MTNLDLPATRHVFWPVEFGNIPGDKMPLVQSSKTIKSYPQLMEKKNSQLLSMIW